MAQFWRLLELANGRSGLGRWRIGLLSLALTCAFSTMAYGAEKGVAAIEGRLQGNTGAPIVGALVKVGDASATTNAQGVFTFKNVAAGEQVLDIAAPGNKTLRKLFTLVPGSNKLPAILLDGAVELSDIQVTASQSAAQNKFDDKTSSETLTETVSDTALKNPNAQNAGDLVKDVSGVTLSKSNGNSNVSLRGIDQRMLRITVDGQRQGGAGNPLDNIPPEIVQSLEVTKTFTPDMEADAVGGVININTGGNIIKKAYVQTRNQANYNALAPHIGVRNSLSTGQPFSLLGGDSNASFSATVNFDDLYAKRERISVLREWTPQISPGPAPNTGQLTPVLTLPVIESTPEHQQRAGVVINGDARFDDLVVFWRSNFSRDEVNRQRNIMDTDIASGSVQTLTNSTGVFGSVPLSRRSQEQESLREALNASWGIKSKWHGNDIDSTLAYTQTDTSEPLTLETGFLSDHYYQGSYDIAGNAYQPRFTFIDETDPADTAAATDPKRYQLNYLNKTQSDIAETDASLKANLKINLDNGVNYLKFGGKLQQRQYEVALDRWVYNAGADVLAMSGLVGAGQVRLETAPYVFGPVPSAGGVAAALNAQPTAFAFNNTQSQINSGSGDTQITESLWALYGMGKWGFGKSAILAGVRIEGTKDDSSGNEMLLGNTGEFLGFRDNSIVNDYIEVLPGLHLRYEPVTGLLYRGSITRSMSRPNAADIAPFRTLNFVDHRARIGAPDLKPYLSTNYDLSVDRYSEAYGLFSVAIFYKKIDHFITDAQYPVTIGDLGEFIEFKRVNGEAAFAMGGELSWQSRPWELPLTLGQGSVETNYSYNHGEAHHPTRPGETFPLPRQVDNQANVKFHDIHGPLSVDASLSYRSGWWEDLIAPDFDNYITSAWDAQLNGAYKINKGVTLSAGVNNLLNRPTKHYAGNISRMNDWQRNGREFNLAVQIKI